MGQASDRAIRYTSSGLCALGCDEDDEYGVYESGRGARRWNAEASAGDGAVLGPYETAERLAVPVFPFDGDGFVRLQLQLMRCGDDVLAAGFTSAELLVERLGEFQPWLGVPSASLLRLVNASAVAGLVIDPSPNLVDAAWTREALAALRKVNDARF